MIKVTKSFFILCCFFAFSPSSYSGSVSINSIDSWSTRVHGWVNKNKPHFSYDNGCSSYTAVDASGENWSGGLKSSGSPGGSCRDSRFRHTFVRIGWIGAHNRDQYGGAHAAIMYAQYFPKDQGNRAFGIGGHRHDWEEIVVFVDKNGNAIKAAASFHGGYKRKSRNANEADYWDGNRIKISYRASGLRNNSFDFTTKRGSDTNKSQWNLVDAKVRDTITAVNWGKASPKLVDSRFWAKVREAW